MIKLKRLLFAMTLLIFIKSILSAPKTWPYMKTYDIWETNKTVDTFKVRPTLGDYSQNFVGHNLLRRNLTKVNRRRAKGESRFKNPSFNPDLKLSQTSVI